MRRPYGSDIDNPDVIDQRGATPSPADAPPGGSSDGLSWDGTSPLVRKSDAQRAVHNALLIGAALGIGGLLVGRGIMSRRPARPSFGSDRRAAARARLDSGRRRVRSR